MCNIMGVIAAAQGTLVRAELGVIVYNGMEQG